MLSIFVIVALLLGTEARGHYTELHLQAFLFKDRVLAKSKLPRVGSNSDPLTSNS